MWRKYLQKTHCKRPLSKINKELLKGNNKKNSTIKKMGKRPERYLTKSDTQMASKLMKRHSLSCH